MNITFQTRDEFKRELIAVNIIKLLDSDLETSPLVVDGPWGSGKTEFCIKLINKINSTKPEWKTLYINSFKYDHVEDPLLVLLTQISSILPENEDKKEFIKKALPIIKTIGKFAGKAGVAWVLKENASKVGEEFVDAITEGTDELLDLGIEKIFEDFEQVEANLTLFKKSLEKISSENKLIVFVDELDRCRPSFALSLLEKIKHVFDVKGVEFIFMANLNQVQAMVKKQYGHEIHAEIYLAKFFPLVIKLPNEFALNTAEYVDNSYQLFLNSVESDTAFKSHFRHGYATALFFKKLFKHHEISLRDSDKFYKNLLIYNAVAKYPIDERSHWIYVLLKFLGVYIYTFDSHLTKKLLKKAYTLDDINKFFGTEAKSLVKDVRGHTYEDVVMMLILELADEDIAFLFSNDGLTKTSLRINEYFRGSFPGTPRGERIELLTNAIKTLQLLV